MAQKYTRPATKPMVGAPAKPTENLQPVQFIFDKGNYLFLAIAVAVVAFGFILMSGTTDIYSNTKIVIAPLVVLAGFGLGFYAILKKPESKI